MEPIIVTVLIDHAPNIPLEFLGFTNYKLYGQGNLETVKESVESVIVDYLDYFSHRGFPLPEPKPGFLAEGFLFEERVERRYEGLPLLIFEYYRRSQN